MKSETATRLLALLSPRSIRFKLIGGVLLVLVPLLAFLFYNNVYSTMVIHNQVAESSRNMLTLYMKEIDASLGNTGAYLNYLISYDEDVSDIAVQQDPDRRMLTKAAISDKLQAGVGAYPGIGSLFFYAVSDDDYMYGFDPDSDVATRRLVEEQIRSLLADTKGARELTKKSWFPVQAGELWYLVRIMPAYDNFVGAWIDVRSLLMPLNFINLGDDGAALLTDGSGTAIAASNRIDAAGLNLAGDFSSYYLSGEKDRYLVVGTRSTQSAMCLVAAIPGEKILENLPYLNRVIVGIAVLAVLLIPLSIFYIRRIILKPMNRLVDAMRQVGEGNIEVRVEDRPTSTEFAMLDRTFNGMLDEIHDLRIGIYEEQIQKQKAELEHLQLQVNPHFFLNSLNIIYRLAQTGRTALIQDMTMSLIQYFRYMFRNRRPVVPLREEIDHVGNYLRIQELRFPERLIRDIRVPEVLLDAPVPPLLIQNFVENAVKYAVSGEAPLRLTIAIDLEETPKTENMHPGESDEGDDAAFRIGPAGTRLAIRIRDDGPGFPPEVLTDLRAGRRIQREDGEHIGAFNAGKRLKLLYGDSAEIAFSNAEPSGACIDIRIPLMPDIEMKWRSPS